MQSLVRHMEVLRRCGLRKGYTRTNEKCTWAEKGKQGLKRASWERHSHCWKGHVWSIRVERHMAYGDVKKGIVMVEEGTCGLKRIHSDKGLDSDGWKMHIGPRRANEV